MSGVKTILIILCGLALALGGAYWVWLKPQIEFANIGTAYAAKKMCSCLNVAELSLDQCKADFTEDLSMVTFVPLEHAVRVEVMNGRISGLATYRPGLGCSIVPDEANRA